jgi:hypothetical protein
VITDAGGVPLVAETTAANVPDVNPMIGLVDAIPPVRGKPGRPRRRPESLSGDRGFDSDPHPPEEAEAAWHPTADRAASDGARQWPGEVSLVRGADVVVAAQLREVARPQGPFAGHPSGISLPGLRGDLFTTLMIGTNFVRASKGLTTLQPASSTGTLSLVRVLSENPLKTVPDPVNCRGRFDPDPGRRPCGTPRDQRFYGPLVDDRTDASGGLRNRRLEVRILSGVMTYVDFCSL